MLSPPSDNWLRLKECPFSRVCGIPAVSSVPPCPPLAGARRELSGSGLSRPDSLSSTTINPAVRWAWTRYPRGDDGAGIVVSRVSPESEDALALKSLPAFPCGVIARRLKRPVRREGNISGRAASRVRIAAAAKRDSRERKSRPEAACRSNSSGVSVRLSGVIPGAQPGPSLSVAGLARIGKAKHAGTTLLGQYRSCGLQASSSYCGPTVPTGFGMQAPSVRHCHRPSPDRRRRSGQSRACRAPRSPCRCRGGHRCRVPSPARSGRPGRGSIQANSRSAWPIRSWMT